MIMSKRHIALSGTIIAVGVASFGLARAVMASNEAPPHAMNRPRVSSDALPTGLQAIAEEAGLQLDTSREIAASIYLVAQSGDHLCLVNTAHGMGMGCVPKARFFDGRAAQLSMSEVGPPDAPSALTLGGIVRSDVATVRVVFPSGTVEVRPTADGGFSIGADAA